MNTITWKIDGDITSEKIASIRKRFERILKRQYNLIVDLTNMQDIDLAGFNLLIGMYMETRRADGQICFQSGENPKLLELIDRTKLHYVFK